MTEANTAAAAQQEEVPQLPDPIIFTDAAVNKVRDLMKEEGNPNLMLRVFVQGGGCAGFQYAESGRCRDGEGRREAPDRLHELSVSCGRQD